MGRSQSSREQSTFKSREGRSMDGAGDSVTKRDETDGGQGLSVHLQIAMKNAMESCMEKKK